MTCTGSCGALTNTTTTSTNQKLVNEMKDEEIDMIVKTGKILAKMKEGKGIEECASEFGKGLCYCLGLFLEHGPRYNADREAYKESSKGGSDLGVEMWFYAAGDHLFEFQPEHAPEGLKERCRTFRNKVLAFRLSFHGDVRPTEKDFDWAIQEAKELLRLIDSANGVPTEKGTWE